MRLDDAGYVGHTVITYLDSAHVEYFVELGSFGEVLVDLLSIARLLGSVFCV